MLIRLQLHFDWDGPLMVAMLCVLLAIDVALSTFLYVLLWSWPYQQTTYNNVAICVVNYVKYDHIYLYTSKVNVCCTLGDYGTLWLCAYMCSVRVDAWLFLLDYMSL